MSDERPPLPETDDPWQLLGVPRGADERAIKQAYARLVRLYRPGDAPDEFARIQEAFERARGGVTRPAPIPRTRAAEPPVEPSRLIPEIGALLEARAYPALWTRLCQPDAVVAVTEDPEIAKQVLRAVGRLAWRNTDAAWIVKHIGNSPLGLRLGPWLDEAEQEVALARRLVLVRPALQPAIYDLIADVRAPAPRAQAITAVAPGLLHPDLVLDDGDRLCRYLGVAATLVIKRLRAAAPPPPDNSDELRRALVALVPTSRARLAAVLAAVTAVLVFVILAVSLPRNELDGRMVVLPGLAAGAVLLVHRHFRKHAYEARVRLRLAATVARLGVPVDAVLAWIDTTPRFGRKLRSFRHDIDADTGLAFLGAIAALVRSRPDELP